MEECRRIDGIEGLVDFISCRYRKAAEIGIGHFSGVAYGLLEKGLRVFATDIVPFHYEGIRVITDDITSPDASLYREVDLIYSMRPPPELVPYMKRLAETSSADLIVKTLSSEYVEGCRLVRNGTTTFFVWKWENSVLE